MTTFKPGDLVSLLTPYNLTDFNSSQLKNLNKNCLILEPEIEANLPDFQQDFKDRRFMPVSYSDPLLVFNIIKRVETGYGTIVCLLYKEAKLIVDLSELVPFRPTAEIRAYEDPSIESISYDVTIEF